MRNLLFILFLLILLKTSIINVIAESNILVQTENPDISIDLSISNDVCDYDEKELYFKYPEKKSSFFKTFRRDRGVFTVKIRAYADADANADIDADAKLCGALHIYRHIDKIHVLGFQFFPSPDMQETPACHNSGFQLEFGDDLNSKVSFKKIPFASKEIIPSYFQQTKKYRMDKIMEDFDAHCNIIVYKDSTAL